MGIQFNFDTAAAIDFVDGLLMDVARRVQVPPIKHEEAIAHYTGLCEHVDRVGSPLEDKVLEIIRLVASPFMLNPCSTTSTWLLK